MTPLEALYQQAGAHAKDTILIKGEEAWTYQRLAGAVERFARGLIRRGVRPGDRIALHMANSPELAVAFYACVHIGAIAAPLNNRFKAMELSGLLQRLQPALYIGHASLYQEVAAVDAAILAPNARVIVDAPAEDPMSRCATSLFVDGGKPVAMATDLDATAMLLATSGTTGQSKFVAHSLASMTAIVAALAEIAPGRDETALIAVPMVHAAGLFTLLSSIRYSAPVVLLERFDADAALDAIERWGIKWMVGLPFMYASLIEKQQLRARNVASLRRCFVSGDVCPLPVQEQFAKIFGPPLQNVLGMTETAGSLTYGLEPGPINRIAKGAHVRLLDDNGIPVAPGVVGELAIRGPNVTIGYWVSPNRIETALHNGWFRTGDMLRQDEKGNLWYVARKKDLIIRGGSNISPVEVENVLAAHPAVGDAAVIGVPDPELGQRVVAFVRLATEMQSKICAQILAEVAPHLADYKMPERLQIVDTISRNALGKIDRKALLTAEKGLSPLR